MSMVEAAGRLRHEGFVVLDATPDAYLDEAIIGEVGQNPQLEGVIFHYQSEPANPLDIIEIAARSGQKVVRVAADLRAAGFIVPPMNEPGVVDDELQQICAESSQTSIMDLPFDDRLVPVGVVMGVANEVVLPPSRVAERLRPVGYVIPPETANLADEDRFLVSRDLDGMEPWLEGGCPVPVWHLAKAAIKFDRDPKLIARRMRELGYEIPEGWD